MLLNPLASTSTKTFLPTQNRTLLTEVSFWTNLRFKGCLAVWGKDFQILWRGFATKLGSRQELSALAESFVGNLFWRLLARLTRKASAVLLA
jgi:hypothetical protein